jgi:methionyl-tRNA formyltransferase
MRIVYMGTPNFSVPPLEALLAAQHHICAVYTRAPAPSGKRNLSLLPSPVHALAEARRLIVRTPGSFTPEVIRELAGLRPEAIVVVAYGRLLTAGVLNAAKLGCWNLHASLLPRWRGAAPIQRAIQSGDPETGVCVMRMAKGLDTGPVARLWRTEIGAAETASDLAIRLSQAGARLITEFIEELRSGEMRLTQQPTSGATYARKIDKSEASIDWASDGLAVARRVNAFSASPGAYAQIPIGGAVERVKLLRAEFVDAEGKPGDLLNADMTVACGRGAVRIIVAQRPGKALVSGKDLIQGARLSVGQTLISHAPSETSRPQE